VGRIILKTIRVLLANSPAMVPDVIRRLIQEQDDMDLVGDCRGPMKILQETGRTKADAVILVQEGTNEPGLCSQLLAVYPDLIILSLAQDLTAAATYQLHSRRTNLTSWEREHVADSLHNALCRQRKDSLE
jgi:DNA-binding NarL/FixJ family response regulator